MPQLDKFTFAPQVFWLILIFLTLYFVVLYKGLPRLYKILLFRKKKLELYNDNVQNLEKEYYFVNSCTKRFLSSNLKVYKFITDVFLKTLESSFTQEVSLNKNNLNTVKNNFNNNYNLKSVNITKKLYILEMLNSSKLLKNKEALKNILIKV